MRVYRIIINFPVVSWGVVLAVVMMSGRALAHDGQPHGSLPPGFSESVVFDGLLQPVAARFAPDGRVFVLEKLGRLKVFDSVEDTTATLVTSFESDTWTFGDHGSLGLAVDPEFPARPYVYVLYALRGNPGGRLVRLELNPLTNALVGAPTVLLEAWCAIYPSHGVGDLAFGPDGALYVSFGDSASFTFIDWGQEEPVNIDGDPAGPCECDDPPLEGGALRSQDIRTSSDAVGYDGAIIRIDPDTGAALPDNPLYGGDPADDRIVAYGLRNPFRFSVDPVTGSLWIGDVGWNEWEEINYVPDPLDPNIRNFGWPCYSGPGPDLAYAGADLPICSALYAEGTASSPYYEYFHTGSASVTGIVRYQGGDYPSQYIGALIFGDYAAQKLHVMFPDEDGMPDRNNMILLKDGLCAPVDIQLGPNGDIFYVDIGAGVVRRIRYFSDNQPPTAEITVDATYGPSPLTVHFSGLASTDPDVGDVLTYEWDLDNDGIYGDSTAEEFDLTFPSGGNYVVKLRVTDGGGLFDSDHITIYVDNDPPTATITTPLDGATYRVGDIIPFAGTGEDPEVGPLPPSAMQWDIILHHCAVVDPDDCHAHGQHTFFGIAGGQFIALDHEYPCYYEIRLKVTEAEVGQTDTHSIFLLPEIVPVTLQTSPSGLDVTMLAETSVAPLTRHMIINGGTTISTPAVQWLNGLKYTFVSWSDGGDRSHSITAPATPLTLTATFVSNFPPVLAPIGNQSVQEGQLLQVGASVTDPDGTTPSLSASNLPPGASFSDHGDGTGTLTWTPNFDQAGSYANVTIQADDHGEPPLSDSESFSITVINVNRPPNLAAISNQSVAENALLSFNVSASDPDGQIPALAASNLPIGATFTDHGNGTGTFSWTPTYEQAGTYPNVTITANDVGDPPLQDSESFTITVGDVNRAPVINPISDQVVNENEPLVFSISAYDPDGTIPVLSVVKLPAYAEFVEHGNGVGTFRWQPEYHVALDSPYVVTFIAGDGFLVDSVSVRIDVNDTNLPVVLLPLSNATVTVGQSLMFNVFAYDFDGGNVWLSATGLPPGAFFIDDAGWVGVFGWKPTAAALNSSPYNVTFWATDGFMTVSQSIQITVQDVAQGLIQVTWPRKGEILKRGSVNKVQWTSAGEVGETVSIELYRKKKLATVIKSNVSNDGSFNWAIPASTDPGGGYYVRVKSKSAPHIFGDSKGTFTIIE